MSWLALYFPFIFFTALAASGGQIPISALEGSGQMFLGGAGGPGAGLRQSLFLNRPTLLPLARSAGMGLVGTPRASPPPGARGASPDSCSISPCSSPASFCSLGDASPPHLGGAMAEWRPHQAAALEGSQRDGRKKTNKTRLFNQSHLSIPPFLSCALSLITSLNAKNTEKWAEENRDKERTG